LLNVDGEIGPRKGWEEGREKNPKALRETEELMEANSTK